MVGHLSNATKMVKMENKCELCGKQKGTEKVYVNQDFRMVKGKKQLVWIDPIMICKKCYKEQKDSGGIEPTGLTEDDL